MKQLRRNEKFFLRILQKAQWLIFVSEKFPNTWNFFKSPGQIYRVAAQFPLRVIHEEIKWLLAFLSKITREVDLSRRDFQSQFIYNFLVLVFGRRTEIKTSFRFLTRFPFLSPSSYSCPLPPPSSVLFHPFLRSQLAR